MHNRREFRESSLLFFYIATGIIYNVVNLSYCQNSNR